MYGAAYAGAMVVAMSGPVLSMRTTRDAVTLPPFTLASALNT